MVLIISEHGDSSTDYVIDWLSYFQKKFLRINRNEFLNENRPDMMVEFDSTNNSFELRIQEENILMNIDYIWFRRSLYPYLPDESFQEIRHEPMFTPLKNNFYYDYYYSSSIFYSYLENNKKTLGNFRKWRLNKIDILNKAKSHGLEVPATLITSSKKDVQQFIKHKKAIITKSLSEVFDIRIETNDHTELYVNYTEKITEEVLDGLPDSFSYSLFQEMLEKDLEIRVFYINHKCYSMAIFSQQDEQTSVDFRKYSNNRNVPYQISNEIESKICSLMADINLNTGSIDFVKTKDNRFVFLEINPTGQYGMTSDPCNFYLDKIIAEHLINNEK